jgi:hypothetical protein
MERKEPMGPNCLVDRAFLPRSTRNTEFTLCPARRGSRGAVVFVPHFTEVETGPRTVS